MIRAGIPSSLEKGVNRLIRRLLCAVGHHAFSEHVFERGTLVKLRCLYCPVETAGWRHEGLASIHNRRPRLLFIRRKKKKRAA